MSKTSKASYYIYGKHAVIAALQNTKRTILSVYCTEKIFKEYQQLIGQFPHKITSTEYMTKIVGDVVHQDLIAHTKPIAHNIKNLDFEANNKIIILDQITDVHNIGSIIRSTAFFGIKTMIVQDEHTPEENGVMAKVASGGLEFIDLYRVVNLATTLKFLKENGFWIVGLDVDGQSKVEQRILNDKIGLVIGAEHFGMRRLTKENCDLLWKIEGGNAFVDSLNAGVAAAIGIRGIL